MDKDTLISSFGKWVEPFHRLKLQEKIDQTYPDKYVKKLTTQAYILLFLHAVLQKREGLRAIADDLLQEEFQKILGFESISASQLSRKHNRVDSDLLEGVFFDLVTLLTERTKLPTGSRRALKIIDSSTITLCLQKYKWATFRQTKAGVKIHLRLVFANEQVVYPDRVTLTTARPSDRSQMDELNDETDAMYVFDRGYLDYKKFDEYCDHGIHFTTRLKENAVYRLINTQVLGQENILSESTILLGTQSKAMKHGLRLIEVLDTQGNLIRIVTNRWDVSAEEISEIYRSRWAIELFFKWMKQHVRIKNFYGTSESAVWNQIFLALIAYCLLLLVKLETSTSHSLLQLSRWLLVTMWSSSEKWLEKILKKPNHTSRGRPKRNK
jgi:IS4 transposase